MSPLPVIDISGSPRERGRAHGETLRALVRARDARWREQIEANCGMASDRFIERFLLETRFLPAIQRLTPELLEETRGIAEGSDLPYEAVLAAQFMDEEWWWSEPFLGRHHCSGFGALTADGAIAAQNMDLGVWMDGFQTLLRIEDRARCLESYVLTVAGIIGLCGVNSAGFALCVNTLLDLNHRSDGLPVAFVARGALERRSAAEAAAFLETVPHASGQNYILADPTAVLDYECSAAGAVRVPYPVANRAWHTNHSIASGDKDAARATSGWADHGRDSRNRLAAVERRIGDGKARVDPGLAQATLSSKDDPRDPVSRRKDRGVDKPATGFTFASVIWEVGAHPAAHVAPGAPCSHEFATYEFAKPALRRAVAP